MPPRHHPRPLPGPSSRPATGHPGCPPRPATAPPPPHLHLIPYLFHPLGPQYDITHFFSVRHVLALEAAMPPAERAALPLVWRGDWRRYCNTYMASVCKWGRGRGRGEGRGWGVGFRA